MSPQNQLSKKRYRKPVISEYGSITEITRTSIGDGKSDGGSHPDPMRTLGN